MTDDARIAEAMGWTPVAEDETGAMDPEGIWHSDYPDFSSPAGFVALLLWHAKEGRILAGAYNSEEWIFVVDGFSDATTPTPAAALVKATVAWLDARGGGK